MQKHINLPSLNHLSPHSDLKNVKLETEFDYSIQKSSKVIQSNLISFKGKTFSLNNVKRGRSNDTSILKQIDTKLETHQQEIETRNDMIQSIEQGVNAIRSELVKEKIANEDHQRQIANLLQKNGLLTSRIKVTITKMEKYQNQLLLIEKKTDSSKSEGSDEILQFQQKEQMQQQLIQNDLLQKIARLQAPSLQKDIGVSQSQYKLLKNQLSSQEKQYELLIIQLKNQQDRLNEEEIEKNNLKARLLISDDQYEMMRIRFLTAEDKFQKKFIQSNLEKDTILFKQKGLNESLVNQTDSLRQQIDELLVCKEDSQNLVLQIYDKNTENEQMKSQAMTHLQTIKDLEKQIYQMSLTQNEDLVKMEDQKQQASQKQALIDSIKDLEKCEIEIVKNLKCTYCKEFIKKPVTVIPCGHSYCFDCKKGYGKDCSKCGPKLNIEAIYRNELLEDIIKMVKILQESINMMKMY